MNDKLNNEDVMDKIGEIEEDFNDQIEETGTYNGYDDDDYEPVYGNIEEVSETIPDDVVESMIGNATSDEGFIHNMLERSGYTDNHIVPDVEDEEVEVTGDNQPDEVGDESGYEDDGTLQQVLSDKSQAVFRNIDIKKIATVAGGLILVIAIVFLLKSVLSGRSDKEDDSTEDVVEQIEKDKDEEYNNDNSDVDTGEDKLLYVSDSMYYDFGLEDFFYYFYIYSVHEMTRTSLGDGLIEISAEAMMDTGDIIWIANLSDGTGYILLEAGKDKNGNMKYDKYIMDNPIVFDYAEISYELFMNEFPSGINTEFNNSVDTSDEEDMVVPEQEPIDDKQYMSNQNEEWFSSIDNSYGSIDNMIYESGSEFPEERLIVTYGTNNATAYIYADGTGYIMCEGQDTKLWYNNYVDFHSFYQFYLERFYNSNNESESDETGTEEEENQEEQSIEADGNEVVNVPDGYTVSLGLGNKKFIWNNRGFLADDYTFNNDGLVVKVMDETSPVEGYRYFGSKKIDSSEYNDGVNFYIDGLWYTWIDALCNFGNPGTVNDTMKKYTEGSADCWKETGCFYNYFGSTKVNSVRIEPNGEIWFLMDGFDDEYKLEDVEASFGEPKYVAE